MIELLLNVFTTLYVDSTELESNVQGGKEWINRYIIWLDKEILKANTTPSDTDL